MSVTSISSFVCAHLSLMPRTLALRMLCTTCTQSARGAQPDPQVAVTLLTCTMSLRRGFMSLQGSDRNGAAAAVWLLFGSGCLLVCSPFQLFVP